MIVIILSMKVKIPKRQLLCGEWQEDTTIQIFAELEIEISKEEIIRPTGE